MKKLLSGALALVLCAALSGCGSTSGDEKSLVIGASITPHAEIIKNIQPDLEEMGYTVEIVEFSDYVKPNTALEDGELDECDLSLRDINTIKHSFAATLAAMYHTRIKYAEQEKKKLESGDH